MRGVGLLYVSNGNIPSRWAHTLQTMRMSEALARLVPQFRLLIGGALADRRAPRIDLWSWYGIAEPFAIERLPLWLWRRQPLFERELERRFVWIAGLRAAQLRPALVWTRAYPVADACLRRGLPVIFERHSPIAPRLLRLFARLGASPLLRGLVTNSEALVAQYVAAGLPASKVIAARNAVPAARVDPAPPQPDAPRVAVYAGRLSEAKGVQTVLDVAMRAPWIRFRLYGGSPAEVAHWRARSGRRANIEFHGHVSQSELMRQLAQADVGLVPNSARDALAGSTSPLKLFDYLAAGLPVVASAIPAMSGWLREADNAFLFRPDDPDDLLCALERALANPARAAEVAARARRELGVFTWRARAEGILARLAPELLA